MDSHSLPPPDQTDEEAEALEVAGFCACCGEEAHAGGNDEFHLMYVYLSDPRGPLHVVAGYTDHPGGAEAFGDVVTACGLTLPWGTTHRSNVLFWLNAPSRCGDCFRNASVTDTDTKGDAS